MRIRDLFKRRALGRLSYVSVCSGIEAASVAWEPLGWTPRAFAEIEPFPCAVLRHHHPTVPNLGSIERFHEWSLPRFDVLVGGTPCQAFSVAGLRQGLADPRGNLALVYLGILDRFRPRWAVWENVPGVLSSNGGGDFGAFLGALVQLGYGFAYRVLDAQYCGVPQRRRRVFVVAHLGDWRGPAAVLFERESLRGDSGPRREARKGAPGALAASPGGAGQVAHTLRGEGFDASEDGTGRGVAKPLGAHSGGGWCGSLDNDTFIVSEKRAFGGNNMSGPIDVTTALLAHSTVRCDLESETFIVEQPPPVHYGVGLGSDPLFAEDLMMPLTNRNGDPGGVANEATIRRLTPVECERLQGFPDGHTMIPWKGKSHSDCPDGPRYKALGNSMAVPVMRWVGERIQTVDQLLVKVVR